MHAMLTMSVQSRMRAVVQEIAYSAYSAQSSALDAAEWRDQGCVGSQVRLWDIRMSGCTALLDQHYTAPPSTARKRYNAAEAHVCLYCMIGLLICCMTEASDACSGILRAVITASVLVHSICAIWAQQL